MNLAKFNLIFQVLTVCLLTVGAVFARKGQIPWHRRVQLLTVLAGFTMIGAVMIPSFHQQILNRRLWPWSDSAAAVGWAHAVVGTFAVLLSSYAILVARTELLPERLRFKSYRLWMRSAFLAWWMAMLLGVATYFVWNVGVSAKSVAQAPAPAAKVTINISNFKFSPDSVSISVGDTVEWIDVGGRHTVQADNGSFQSGTLVAGQKFTHRFEKAGTFAYFCDFHGSKGGHDMSGVVQVR